MLTTRDCKMLKTLGKLLQPIQRVAVGQYGVLGLNKYATGVPVQLNLDNANKIEATKDQLFSKLEVELRSVDPAVLKSYSWFAQTAAEHLNIEVGHCWAPRKAHHNRLTLLKSVHIYKKHRVQYEIRTYFRYMNFHKLTGSTLDTFLEYIERNLPEGVALKTTKIEIQELTEHLIDPPKE